jgi:GDPmannose 4,6-dehydratase
MWLSLQHATAEDFVFATGTSTTVREFATAAFMEAGIVLEFQGEGESETASDAATHRTLLRVEPKFFRRVDSHSLVGDSSKAQKLLGWKPSTAGSEVARILTRAEIETLHD